MNSEKNTFPNRIGSQGYAKKVPEWDKQEEDMVVRSVSPATVDWEP